MTGKVLSSKTVKVRKPRVCFGCSRQFPIGTEMLRDCVAEGNTVFSMYLCDDCQEITSEMNGEEFGLGDLADSLNEKEEDLKRISETLKLLSRNDYYLISHFKTQGLLTVGNYKGDLVFGSGHLGVLGTIDIDKALDYTNKLPYLVKHRLLGRYEKDTTEMAAMMLGHCVDFEGDLYSYQEPGGIWNFTRDLDFAIKAQTSYLESEIKEEQ